LLGLGEHIDLYLIAFNPILLVLPLDLENVATAESAFHLGALDTTLGATHQLQTPHALI
jgi:hypothetical protein